jgi:hypothetical protein
MTEDEWLACTDPQAMLEFLRGTVSERKLLLITAACCRHAWWCCLTSRRCTEALKRAERDADNSSLSEKELRRTNSKLSAIAASSGYLINTDEGRAIVIRLGRDIVGNPFRPVPIEPAWVTVTVTNLAATAYEERAMPRGGLGSARLAVLSDALEEAGCDNAKILAHCRGPGPHVRGCWVVDLILGKK